MPGLLAGWLELSSLVLIWSEFEQPTKNRLIKNLAIILVGCILFYFTIDLYPVTALFINHGFLIMFISLVYNKNTFDVILKLIISYALVVFIEFLLLITFSPVIDNFEYLKEYKLVELAGLLLFIVVILLITPVFKKFISSINSSISKINFQFKNIWLVNTLVYCFIVKLIWDFSPQFIINNKVFIFLVFVLVYVLNIFVYRNDVLTYEKTTMEQYYNQYYPVLTNIVEDMRSRQHEYKNHLNVIYGIAEITNEKNVKQELRSYIESVNYSFEDVNIVRSSNNILNAIIYSKVVDAEKHHIDFTYRIGDVDELPIEDFELTEILANLLNNAFEAIVKSETTKRIVRLELCKTEEPNMFIMVVKNNGTALKMKEIDKLFKRGFSTKNRGSGYGLYNVKQIIDDKKGNIEITVEEGITTFKVKIPY
ncbi:GHKL domain-containing protein [Clostridium sp. 'deep sea']|uniref:sensor histidine kinase n=1 Tax=Clostridium sp. 'deep sea' TaxID=2779445 RepID=UPI0018967418|nr:GHKL domain-containing protein [Clostridium sp. 'deep sea']QOR35279.1 GHKL domain-containing protein [Clostridium sp. 'deep sea']